MKNWNSSLDNLSAWMSQFGDVDIQ